MAGTDLVPYVQERQIRSYQRALLGERVVHSLGKDLRSPRPIPVRGFVWAAGLETFAVATFRIADISPRPLTTTWGVIYGVVPLSFACLLTVARVEGRRVHVAMGAWMRHSFRRGHLAGGCERISPRTIRHHKGTRIRVAVAPAPRRRVGRYVAAAMPLLALLAVAAILLGNGTRHPVSLAPRALLPTPASIVGPLPVPRVAATKASPAKVRHRSMQKPRHVVVSRRTPPRHHKAAVRTRTSAVSTHAAVFPTHPVPVLRRPSLQISSPPRAVATRSRAVAVRNVPTCYPGQLGC